MSTELQAALEALYALKDRDLREKFNRSLPFQDAMFDRWKRAQQLGFGEKSNIYNSALVFGDVTVGKNVWIGPNVILDGSGGKLSIGNDCSIGAGTHIYTHDTLLATLSGDPQQKKTGPVSIGNNNHIGPQCIFLLGIDIGNQCVIAGGSFVNKSVPDRTVVAGSPAKKIGEVRVAGDGAITLVY